MSQRDVPKLDSGSAFPALSYDLVGGGTQALPPKQWSVVLFYRGYW